MVKASFPQRAVEDILRYADLRGAYATLHADKHDLDLVAQTQGPPKMLFINDSKNPRPPRPNVGETSQQWDVSILDLGAPSSKGQPGPSSASSIPMAEALQRANKGEYVGGEGCFTL